ncbi:MAG TPA: hypothetical protein VGB91_07790 [Rhizomicrobium sp.]
MNRLPWLAGGHPDPRRLDDLHRPATELANFLRAPRAPEAVLAQNP